MPVRTTLFYKIRCPESFISLPHAYLILNLSSCHYSTCFPTIFYAFFVYPTWTTIKIMLSTVFIVFRGEHKTARTHTIMQMHVYQLTQPGMHICIYKLFFPLFWMTMTYNTLYHNNTWFKNIHITNILDVDLEILNFSNKMCVTFTLEIIPVIPLIPDCYLQQCKQYVGGQDRFITALNWNISQNEEQVSIIKNL
jgi:hypothetical protein